MKKTIFAIALGLITTLLSTGTIALAQSLSADTVAKLDAFFGKYGEHTPGASATISRSGEIIYHRHFGMADLEHQIPVSDSTVFEAGSVSKQFTATCILLLVNDGKLALDDAVRKYVPELPDYGRALTIRHLLNHTSGLKDWGTIAALGGWARGTRIYTNEIALGYIIRQPDLNYLPGEEYLYSNSNYTLLTIIVERVSGKSLAQFTQEQIFQPLEMTQTSWRTNFREVMPNRAIGYQEAKGAYVMDMPFENTYGHAALLTTTRDLDRWNTSWGHGTLGDALLPLRIERGILLDGDTIDYAAGVRIGMQGGKAVVDHSGATAGYRAWLSYFPEEDLSVAFLSNDASALTTATGRGLAAVFVGDGPKVSTPAEHSNPTYGPDSNSLEDIPGEYVSIAADGCWQVHREGDTSWVTIYPHARKHILKPIGLDRFTANGLGEIRIVRDDDGIVRGLYVSADRARNVWFKKR